jgi:stress response protein YsnF
MPKSRGGQERGSRIALRIASLRSRVQQAWRLARGIHNVEASEKLKTYAEELEANLQKLEAQAAVIKETTNEAQQTGPEEAVAALKPPADPKPND